MSTIVSPYMTVAEVAAHYRVTERKVRDAITSGSLIAHDVGREYRIHSADASTWWASLTVVPSGKKASKRRRSTYRPKFVGLKRQGLDR